MQNKVLHQAVWNLKVMYVNLSIMSSQHSKAKPNTCDHFKHLCQTSRQRWAADVESLHFRSYFFHHLVISYLWVSSNLKQKSTCIAKTQLLLLKINLENCRKWICPHVLSLTAVFKVKYKWNPLSRNFSFLQPKSGRWDGDVASVLHCHF